MVADGNWQMRRRGAKERGQEKAQWDLSKRESWDDGPEGRRKEGSTWPGVVLKMSRSHWERCSLEGVRQDLEGRRGSPGLGQQPCFSSPTGTDMEGDAEGLC